MPLDTKTLQALRPQAKPYRVSDGGGLLLQVSPKGGKTWIARVTVDGKRKDIGLGGYPAVSLKEARAAALEAKSKAEKGINPAEAKRAARGARKAEREAEKLAQEAKDAARRNTFAAVAERCIASLAPGFKNARTADMWRASLRLHAAPLADLPVAEIDREKVRAAIEDIWLAKPVIAKKTLRRIGAVLRYAAALGLRANDDPANLKILHAAGLPMQRGGRRQPSLPWTRVPAFMVTLDRMPGLGPLALRLAILTALRSGEVRGARWSEISFDGATPVWTIPGLRMKGKKTAAENPHRVPLSAAALGTLARALAEKTGEAVPVEDLPQLAALQGAALIFPSSRDTPVSDMALSAVVRRMNGEASPPPWRDADGRPAVPHGFRATFSTWVDDTRPAEREAAERALAHEVGNKVSARYRRSDLLDRRIPLMAAWAEHCESGGAGTVVKLPKRREAQP